MAFGCFASSPPDPILVLLEVLASMGFAIDATVRPDLDDGSAPPTFAAVVAHAAAADAGADAGRLTSSSSLTIVRRLGVRVPTYTTSPRSASSLASTGMRDRDDPVPAALFVEMSPELRMRNQ